VVARTEAGAAVYLDQHFRRIVTPLFVEGRIAGWFFPKGNLHSGVAQIWSYRYGKRLLGHRFPDELEYNAVRRATLGFLNRRNVRGILFRTLADQPSKRLLVLKRGNLAEALSDRDPSRIILAEDVLFPEELKPRDQQYIQDGALAKALDRAADRLEASLTASDQTPLRDYAHYISSRFETLLGAKPEPQMVKDMLVFLLSQLLDRDWMFNCRVFCNLVEGVPTGEMMFRARKEPVGAEQLRVLQYISNYVFGWLAMRELETLKDERPDAVTLIDSYKAGLASLRLPE
jgi:hypothetical protein